MRKIILEKLDSTESSEYVTGTYRSKELGEWRSTITSESPELSRCSSESSNASCGIID